MATTITGNVTSTNYSFPSGLSAQTITYVNTTGKVLFFNAYGSGSAGTTTFSLAIDSKTVSYCAFGANTDGNSVSGMIPPDKTAVLTIAGNNFSAGQYVITG